MTETENFDLDKSPVNQSFNRSLDHIGVNLK